MPRGLRTAVGSNWQSSFRRPSRLGPADGTHPDPLPGSLSFLPSFFDHDGSWHRNIAEVSDVSAIRPAQTRGVELRLWLDDDQPVSGRIGSDAHAAVPFVGWLGLLGLLEELVASGRACATDDGPSRQLGAGGDPQLGEHV